MSLREWGVGVGVEVGVGGGGGAAVREAVLHRKPVSVRSLKSVDTFFLRSGDHAS